MISLSDDKQADIIDAFGTASRCLGGVLGVDGVCFGTVVGRIYPSELQLNGANTSDTEAGVLDLYLSISNDIIYDKRDDIDLKLSISLF